jgi:transcriptional regulator GlxA family with amidase domain
VSTSAEASVKTQIVLYDGFDELDAVAPYEVLTAAGRRGGRSADRTSPIGAWVEAERGVLPRAIARLHAGGATVASVCTGAMLLAAAGLTRGRRATTHHVAREELRASGAQLVDARVVDDGELITAGGITSGLDLGLWLVERHAGAALALELERHLEYERRGTVWRRPP